MFVDLQTDYENALQALKTCLDKLPDDASDNTCAPLEKNVDHLAEQILAYAPQSSNEIQHMIVFFLAELQPQLAGEPRYERLCEIADVELKQWLKVCPI